MANGAYTAVAGDTLGAIAMRMAPNLPVWGSGGSLEMLLAANPGISDPNVIYPGLVISNPWFTASPPAQTPAAAALTSPQQSGTPSGSPGDVAGGSEFQMELLRQILGDEVGRVLIPQLNASIMQSLGFVAPSLVGLTDPLDFREGLQGLNLSQRGGEDFIPTAEASAAFSGQSIARNMIAPTSALSLSATNTPTEANVSGRPRIIPTLASRLTGANRIFSALGSRGGSAPSVGVV